MTTVEKIKDGLLYSIKPHFIKRENNSFLTSHETSIALTCEFSELDCSLTFTDTPISHDIIFTFHHNYLKTFSSDFDINQFPDNLQHDICCNTQMILHDILNCKLIGAFKNILFLRYSVFAAKIWFFN